MTNEQRMAHWRAIVEKQTESGLSAAAFCREHHLKVSQFYRWHVKFRKNNGDQDRASAGFLELLPGKKQTGSGIRIKLRSGVIIDVQRGFDPVTLRQAIETLSGTP
jgi:hypothetical protein